tara:strand:+ start:271 stop:1644 length:1374 start_codon:yes stop_codon:yes gene_type:complete
MKILILGAGKVGGTIAESLAREAFDITVVDNNPDVIDELRDKLDVRTIHGSGSHPDVLRQAGADDADMLIAVTANDEVNMVACQVCYSLFHTPKKIARIRSSSYLTREGFFGQEHMPIDVLINPEEMVVNNIRQLLEHPGALQVLDFADGRVQLVAVSAYHGGPLVGQELRFLREHMPGIDARVAAIFRRGQAITPKENTVIEVDDEVFFIAAAQHINAVTSELRKVEKPFKRIIIAGGGNIGVRLARSIEDRFSVKVLELNQARCQVIAEEVDTSIILNIDVTDKELLLEENIEHSDVFCAVTNDDEVNIMSSLLAKQLGVRQVMSLISKPAYVDLVQGGEIDIAISPEQATISSLLAHIRRADVVRVHSLRRGATEAIEAIVHGDEKNSRVVGRAIADIDLPPGASIGAVARGQEVYVDHDEIIIQAGDHVILFLVDKSQVRAVEKLFQVGVSFF